MLVDIADVRRALEDDKLIPAFQPLVELRTGRLVGFELLARWQHPHLGLVLPDNFIPLVESNGLIGLLMRQVLRKALLSASMIPAPLTLSVNVSPLQLRDLDLPGQFREAADEAGFPLERMTIEVTETALLHDLDRAKTIVRTLKEMGCRLALDDFGTGYSSMGHLQELPFDELKIDRSFISKITKSRESRKIAAAIVGLGHSLDLVTVAEGVETEEQAVMLLWLGCEMGQGWLYGRPEVADGLPVMISAAPQVVTSVSTPGEGWAASSLEALPTQRLAQLQAIYDGAPVGLCFLDRNLRYVSINQRLAEINGSSVAAHLGKSVREMIPEAFPNIEPLLNRALLGEVISEVEVSRPSRAPGEGDRTMRSSYQPAWDEADEVIGISIAVVDISEQKLAEQSILESEDHHQHLAELHPQVPWMMDAAGNSLKVSSRWVLTTGLVKGLTRNLGWLEALHEEDLLSTMKTIREALATGMPIDIEYRVRSVEGEWQWMRSRGSPRIGVSGEITRWYGIVENIDERKQMGAALIGVDPGMALW